jgi:hypothetical protein
MFVPSLKPLRTVTTFFFDIDLLLGLLRTEAAPHLRIKHESGDTAR